jgi:hypothetical protein
LFSLLLVSHVLLPVLNTLLQPLLHEASIPLQLVDLSSSDLLLDPFLLLFLRSLVPLRLFILSVCFILELLQVSIDVHHLLGLVQGLQPCLEERALHFVVTALVGANLECRLVVTHLTGLAEDSDIGRRVDLLQDHLDLVQQSESVATLLLHDLVDQAGVELDIEVAQCWLQLFKVLDLGADIVLLSELCKVLLLVELVKEFSKQVTAGKVSFKIRNRLKYK